ncbi:uncharacterized protein PV07_06229 [Cladophialophora immunda]|uniref:Uncharacterized protein n=1 Tax=Cladophialophora immunda TaxID=569365 RepID=A0A0D2AYY8_9EURO|nr:uncharacterized protein PV07_06229 [Cladophialophora immunda]KIW30487.1 hypothetical protein PV07_06229 [Cladophialophora immunda]
MSESASDGEQSQTTNDHRKPSKWHTLRKRFLAFFTPGHRPVLRMHAFTAINPRTNLKEVNAILRDLTRPIVNEDEGRISELYVPGNNVCPYATLGFLARVDPGALGFSFVKEHVVNDIHGRYTPVANLSPAQRDKCESLHTVNGTRLEILGIAHIALYHRDAPNMLINWAYMVVPDDNPVRFDFILGTDWEYAIQDLAKRLERKSSSPPAPTVAVIHLETEHMTNLLLTCDDIKIATTMLI